ncbi:MAG: hybrid sensor histidine kinase/response regulator [Polaromonas sp.]|nr:hybrid sensor histidine kinase/response regulator [Polaromonas sp.]
MTMDNENNFYTANILIVDDLPENLLALDALIRKEGRRIFQASCGEDALDLLLSHEFALAILDVQMPGMNGFELAELMRGTEKTRHVPIVFVTAAGKDSNYAFKGYEAGAVDFLFKPLDVQAVRSKADIFVELHAQRHQTRMQMAALEAGRREQQALLLALRTTEVELLKALKMRDDFMSLVAHELRTPLNTLSLETRMRRVLLDRGRIEMFDAAYLSGMVSRDQRQIESMVRLIEDMLDASRVHSNRLSIRTEKVDIAKLLTRVAGDLSHQAEAAGCRIGLAADSSIHAEVDSFRIEQVVINLLTNALRYGKGKPVELVLRALPEGLLIEVHDQGMGISEENQNRIFEQFERAVGNDGTGGLGLGLFISRQLVKAHGGQITLTSSLGKGSVFSVSLPFTQANGKLPATVVSDAAQDPARIA